MDYRDCTSLEDVTLKQELLQSTFALEENEIIFHYTNVENLEKILMEDKISLRLTRHDLLNDFTEKVNIEKFYKDLCNELFNYKMIDKKFYDAIIGLKSMRKLPYFKSINKHDGIHTIDGVSENEFCSYIFCFSMNEDSLPLWNYYLKNGRYKGINIGIEAQGLRSEVYSDFFLNFYSRFLVVEYDDFEKNDILKDYILALYDYVQQDDSNYTSIKKAIEIELSKWEFAFKYSFFSHENEVRLVIDIPLDYSKRRLLKIDSKKIKYDLDNIPDYIYLDIDNKEILKTISTAPTFDLNDLSVEYISNRYSVEFNKSRIPVKF